MNRLLLAPLLAASLLACGQPDPSTTRPDAGDGETGATCELPASTESLASCQPLASDYRPRVNGSADDAWPACISDDNTYHRIQESISTIARVEAFEQIAARLWEGGRVPAGEDFVQARALYAQDQGLDSRVQRREDIHYPPAPNGAKCSEAGVPEANPDRCVGPAKLLPVLNDAFARGSAGSEPLVQAARIEAALLWFLYVSSLSEVTSCADKPQDCDSAWAYYTGGTPREQPLGLSRYVAALAPETHARAYDGTLAVRCWRNLDNETGVATHLDLRDQARAQLDRATLRGVALVLRQRLEGLACEDAGRRQAALAFFQTLAPLLDRGVRALDAAHADALRAEAAKADPAAVDVGRAQAALDAAFPCP